MAINNSRMLARREPFRGRTLGLDRFFNDPFFRTPLRGFWILLRRLFREWAEHLIIVKPETMIR